MKRKLAPLAYPLLALAVLPAFAATPIDKTVAANPNGNVSISSGATFIFSSTGGSGLNYTGTLSGSGNFRKDQTSVSY